MRMGDVGFVYVKAQRERVSTGVSSVGWVCDLMVDRDLMRLGLRRPTVVQSLFKVCS